MTLSCSRWSPACRQRWRTQGRVPPPDAAVERWWAGEPPQGWRGNPAETASGGTGRRGATPRTVAAERYGTQRRRSCRPPRWHPRPDRASSTSNSNATGQSDCLVNLFTWRALISLQGCILPEPSYPSLQFEEFRGCRTEVWQKQACETVHNLSCCKLQAYLQERWNNLQGVKWSRCAMVDAAPI